MPRTPGEGARRHEIAIEDARQRVAVGEIEVALAGDRDVELHRVYARAKEPLALAAAQNGAQRLDQRRMQLPHALRALHVASLVQVFAVEEGHELRVLEVVAPGELHQALQRLARIAVLEVELALSVADVRVAFLQHREEQLLFGAEVVIEHPLVRAGARRDAVDARATEAVARELDRR